MSTPTTLSTKDIIRLIQDHAIKIVDLQFTDLKGIQHHVSIPSSQFKKEIFETGKAFDGSSIAGWKEIQDSDMLLLPQTSFAYIDPFCEEATLNIYCNAIDPNTMDIYSRDPRGVAQRAENYLKESGIADKAFFGPEPEFCLFEDVRWQIEMCGAFYSLDAEEAAWNTGKTFSNGNYGHRPRVKGGYFPLPPVDSAQDIRTKIALTLEQIGLEVEAHHHEVAGSQNEIAVKFNSLLNKADELQAFKYIVKNVAHKLGKTATFMPKPLVGDNGSGMHCHQSLQKDGVNLFAGNHYAGLSELALFYIGGIIHHAHALNAFTNPSTNSYKRLVPGFEAPVLLAYSSCNRSAAIRIPYSPQANPNTRRIEIRFPDPLANPYLAFSAMVMAGIDGIKNKIHPGDAIEKDLYTLPSSELKNIPSVATSLETALNALENDCAFLLAGDVFSRDLIEAYINLKRQEDTRVRMSTHPLEFELYYSS